MKESELTKAYIRKNSNPANVKLKLSLSNFEEFKKNTYILVVQSITKGCTRLNIYPVSRKKIIKIKLIGSNINDKKIADLSKIFQNYEIIHTSGLLLKAKELYYECYLNLNMSDNKTKDLKISLNKIRNIFKEIKIEEIGLKKSKE